MAIDHQVNIITDRIAHRCNAGFGFTDGTQIPVCAWPTDLTNGERTLPPASGHDPWKVVDGERYYVPMEVCDTLGQKWFWHPDDRLRMLWVLHRTYSRCRERGANLLLNVPPDRSGRIWCE